MDSFSDDFIEHVQNTYIILTDILMLCIIQL